MIWNIYPDKQADFLFKMPWWKEIIFTVIHGRKPGEMPWNINREYMELKELVDGFAGKPQTTEEVE